MSEARVLLGRYPTVEGLFAAARKLRDDGRGRLNFYSPYPLEGADEVLGLRKSPMPYIAGAAGLAGVVLGVLMQWWMNDVDYALNVGNRFGYPPPTWAPVTFELGVLLSGVSIFVGLMALFRFPQPYSPLFEVEAFRSATVDALWLSVKVPAGEVERVSGELRALGASDVQVVPEVP
jgi:hypothetical protein